MQTAPNTSQRAVLDLTGGERGTRLGPPFLEAPFEVFRA